MAKTPKTDGYEDNHPTVMSTLPVPSGEDEEEFLLSCRFGDLDDVQEFIKKYGSASLSNIRDANGNTILHMASGNGHISNF